MKVVLSTIAKFHFFDLARELMKRSMLERIFSGYPRWKLRNEGIDQSIIDTFPWVQVPYMALGGHSFFSGWRETELANFAHETFDRYVAQRIPVCDIFHGLSRYSLKSGTTAKKRGIRYICDVGSSHIGYQESILREEYGLFGIPYKGFHPADIDRELHEYEIADLISIPSDFSRRTFIEKGIPAEKLVKIPYGVDLSLFRPLQSDNDGVFRILFVGGLTVRKGIYYLARAFAQAKIPRSQLILIGSAVRETNRLLEPVKGMDVIRLGHLPQSELAGWFSKADVSVLPSVEDGYGLVILQSLACGCPVIASANTGGSECIIEDINGYIIPIRSSEAIAEKFMAMYNDPDRRRQMRSAAIGHIRNDGTWHEYGDKMATVYSKILR